MYLGTEYLSTKQKLIIFWFVVFCWSKIPNYMGGHVEEFATLLANLTSSNPFTMRSCKWRR